MQPGVREHYIPLEWQQTRPSRPTHHLSGFSVAPAPQLPPGSGARQRTDVGALPCARVTDVRSHIWLVVPKIEIITRARTMYNEVAKMNRVLSSKGQDHYHMRARIPVGACQCSVRRERCYHRWKHRPKIRRVAMRRGVARTPTATRIASEVPGRSPGISRPEEQAPRRSPEAPGRPQTAPDSPQALWETSGDPRNGCTLSSMFCRRSDGFRSPLGFQEDSARGSPARVQGIHPVP